MDFVSGDVWDWHAKGRVIVVTTNIGWTKDGYNVMGAGLAKQAKEKFPILPKVYGRFCRERGVRTPVWYFRPARLFLFPTKPLDEDAPHLSWKQKSSLKLIRRGCWQLLALADAFNFHPDAHQRIVVPLFGCKNGGLDPAKVRPVMEEILDERFICVDAQN